MKLQNLFLAATLSLSNYALACEKPASPTLPDPGKAVTAQMVKAKNDMKAYIQAADAYLACVESDTSKYNSMVDEMQSAAEGFNNIVRKYKKRMSAS